MELLSPAGSMAGAMQAIRSGADALYLGVTDIVHQRSRCQNFNDGELKKIIDVAHAHGVKVHVTFNSSYDSKNFRSILKKIRALESAMIDAVIVSDIGLVQMIHGRYPELPIMFSVQGQCANSEFARLLKEIGVKRVVLDRNVSISEAKSIKMDAGIEVEMFVFGYLCYSQDSICYMGDYFCDEPCNVMCAQNVHIEGQKKRYFFMKYMSGLNAIPKMIEAGIDCVKIEGRQRSSDYVRRTVSVFREAIDSCRSSSGYQVKKRWAEELRKAAFGFETTEAFYEEGRYARSIITDATLVNKAWYLYDCLYNWAETGNTRKLAKELSSSFRLDRKNPKWKAGKEKETIDAFR